MSAMQILLCVLLSPLALLVLYAIAIQYERGGWWRVLAPVFLVAGLVDAIMNYTILRVYTWDRPRAGEYTFTKRLNRLKAGVGWRAWLAVRICRLLDWLAPSGCHCAK